MSKNQKITFGIICSLIALVVIFAPQETFAQTTQDVRFLMADEGSIVRRIWSFTMSLANYILIAALVAMAFGTSLRLDAYSIKKLLPSILTAFVLANSSLFILGIAVDIADLLTNEAKNIAGQGFITNSFSSGVLGVMGSGGLGLLITGGATVLIATTLGAAMIGCGAIILIAVLTVLVVLTLREWALQLYIGFAPLAFMCLALPVTRNIFQTWSSGFMSWLMLTPIAVACLAIGSLFLGMIGDGGGWLAFFVGIFFLFTAAIVPFRVKGIGASMMARVGGIARGLGSSIAASGARSTVSGMAGAKGDGLGAQAVRGIGTSIQKAIAIPEVLKEREASVKKKFDRGIRTQAGVLTGDENIILREQEAQVKDIFESNKNVPIDKWTGSFKGDKAKSLAALQTSIENPLELMNYKNRLTEEISADESLKKALGLTGKTLQEIQKEFANNGVKFAEAFALTTNQAKVDSAGVLDPSTVSLDPSSRQRLMTISNNSIKEGYISGMPIFDKSGKLVTDAGEQTAYISQRLGADPALFAKALTMAKDEIKDGKVAPYITRLFAEEHFTDAVAKQLSPSTMRDIFGPASRGATILQSELSKDVDVKVYDQSTKTFITKSIPRPITASFSASAPIDGTENAVERALKVAYTGANKGSAAMTEAMGTTKASMDASAAQALLNQRSRMRLFIAAGSPTRIDRTTGKVQVQIGGVWEDAD